MISIKMDIQTHEIENDPTSEWGYWGAKSKAETMNIEDLMTRMYKQGNMGIHEYLIGDKYRPYADVDAGKKEGITEENFQVKRYEILKKAMDVMNKTFPDAYFHLFDRSGQKPDGTWKVSGHFIGNNIYYSDKEHIRYLLKQAESTDYFDWQVYNTNHLFCLPYCTKPGDKRRVRYAELKTIGDITGVFLEKCPNKKCQKCPKFEDCDATDEATLASGLITFVDADEKEMPVPAGFKPTEKPNYVAVDTAELTDEQKAAQLQEVTKLIAALSPTRASGRDGWCKGVWALRRLGQKSGLLGAYQKLAHVFAKKTDKDNYSEAGTDNLYMAEPKEDGVGYTTLRKWADEDSPGWNGPVAPEGPTYYEDIYDLIESKPTEAAVQTWMIGCLAYVQSSATWYLRYRDGWKPLPKCPKKFPFSTESEAASISIPGPKGPVEKSFMDILKGIKLSPAMKQSRYITREYAPYFKLPFPGVFNQFEGWPNQFSETKVPDDNPDVVRINSHLFDLGGRDEKVLHFLQRWHAYKIQKPQEKIPLLVFYSKKQGCGKGIWVEFLDDYLFGEKNVLRVTDMKIILGHFNAASTSHLITILEEAKDDGKSVNDSQVLKEMITGKKVTTVKKGGEAEKDRNYSGYIANTNWKGAFDVEPSDRRCVLMSCDISHVGDRKYFDALRAQIHTERAGAAYFNWLSQLDLSNFDPWELPKTELKDEVKIRSLPMALRHVREICEGRRHFGRLIDAKEPWIISLKDAYADFRAFCEEQGCSKATVLQGKYGERIENDLDILNKQQWLGNGKRKTGFKFIYAEMDAAFQKHLCIDHSIFEPDTDDAPDDELAE
jgi:hypothetical protein